MVTRRQASVGLFSSAALAAVQGTVVQGQQCWNSRRLGPVAASSSSRHKGCGVRFAEKAALINVIPALARRIARDAGLANQSGYVPSIPLA
jgi:hypothetical protein